MSSVYLPKNNISPKRIYWVKGLMFFALLMVLGVGYVRLTVEHERLSTYLVRVHSGGSELTAHRGNIYVRDDGEPVVTAMNADIYHIILQPRVFREVVSADDYREPAQQLAQVLEMEEVAIQKAMHSSRGFLYLKKSVPVQVERQVAALAIPGVKSEYKSKRFYPDSMMFAHIIGYTDSQGVGHLGVEHFAEDNLNGADGERRYEGATGWQSKPAVPGSNVSLTLDRRLQYAAFTALAAAVHRHQAASAAAIMVDVRTGAILALANYPSFNPHFIRQEDIPNQVNHALADIVEPASTVKPFVVAAALERNLTQPEEIFATKKPLKMGRLRVFDKHVRDDLTVNGIIQKSSNVGAVLLAQRLGPAALEDTYRRLGLGGESVLNFPVEAAGRLYSHKRWRREDFATHAYGYGFSVTLPQLLRAYSVFATDGRLLTPHLWQGGAPESALGAKVFSPSTARTVRNMLELVVSRKGTASAAIVPGYRVAGKTGTAGKWTDEGKFDLSRRRVFFVGMAPASRPRYLLAVMVDEPARNGDSGGAVAAPVFGQIMRQALLFGGVAPDGLEPPAEVADVSGEGKRL